jgi:hypothetical protein
MYPNNSALETFPSEDAPKLNLVLKKFNNPPVVDLVSSDNCAIRFFAAL